MSAWERARSIPWDHIPQDGSNLEDQKERIFRELQRESIESELQQQERHQSGPTVDGGEMGVNMSNRIQEQPKFPYSSIELLRQAAFGGCIGTITGGVFGFLDGMRGAGESAVLKNASDMAKARFIFQGTSRNGTLFGIFFGGFHVFKYGLRVASNDQLGPYAEIAIAGPISLAILSYKPTWRAAVPYGVMLIGMDGINHAMRRN
eukprot:CAMPEP_0198137894 /NCGR_PEP_ID=MMETSP1443-20131203/1334_1 /TAXON_ID=186043 /ORGANISM="Entomoneis sp., Strain CCMP2396" /LENGTH=204 /DNA_ID=CAMNT_0043799463 /DNA_START=80 /DNA_END=694 /DNA_ORIENTATION=-